MKEIEDKEGWLLLKVFLEEKVTQSCPSQYDKLPKPICFLFECVSLLGSGGELFPFPGGVRRRPTVNSLVFSPLFSFFKSAFVIRSWNRVLTFFLPSFL